MLKMATESSSSPPDADTRSELKKAVATTRFPWNLWTLLFLPYLPIGLCLCLFRICLSLQAILLLLVFPEGKVKRFMLRIFFTVLGIAVTTRGCVATAKLLVSNKVSFLDHIVLHLATSCVSVSTGGIIPPLATLFPHWTFPASDNDAVLEAAKALPEFRGSESVVDFIPYSVQPESVPTNGKHCLLKFREWAFSLESSIQPVSLSVFRPFPVAVSTVYSSGWRDFIWTLFCPITIFHVGFLPMVEPQEGSEFIQHVQQSIASELKIQTSQLTEKDVEKWLAGPPRPKFVANGPILSPSDFDPAKLKKSSSSELESMVHQVTAVMPQVPHTVIRKDLLTTNSVDATITNLIEGHVQYLPMSSNSNASSSSSSASQVFRRKVVSSSAQRHLSLEERKRELLLNAKRKYIEKHGL